MKTLLAQRSNQRFALVGIRERDSISYDSIKRETVLILIDQNGALIEHVNNGYNGYNGQGTVAVLGELPEDWTPSTLLTIAERDPSYGSPNK